MASTAYLNDMGPGKMQRSDTYFTDHSILPGYEKYMAQGQTTPGENYELSRMDSPSQPLLGPNASYFQHRPMASESSLAGISPSVSRDGNREAPLHRPQYSGDMLGANRSASPAQRYTDSPSGSPGPSPYVDSPNPQFTSPYARQSPQRQYSHDQLPSSRPPPQRHQTQDHYPPQARRQDSSYSYTQPPPPQRDHSFDPYSAPTHYSPGGSDSGNMAGRGAHRR